MMWHEARKQERKIRGMLVDYKKRAERRKDYYEKIKADPTQFLQLHGRPCKIHLDPAIAIAGDSPVNMMPWQGNQDILIDRFDVRAHLDFIPEVKQSEDQPESFSVEERHINYERYRILVQNDFLGVGEEKFLRQLHLEEQYGPILRPTDIPDVKLKKDSNARAAIGYNYEEGLSSNDGGGSGVLPLQNSVDASHLPATIVIPETAGDDNDNNANDEDDDDEDDEDDSDIDFDLCVDISKVDTKQAHEMNTCAHMYGMQSNDFFSFLTRDVEEAENLRIAREQEEEKAMYSGRKARRERRAYRDKKLMGRKFSPPSYASRKSPTYFAYRESKSKSLSKSRSRSQSPANTGQVTYITSFGGDEPPPSEISKTSGNSVAGHSRSSVRYRSRTQKPSEIRGRSHGGRSPVFRRSKSRSRGSLSRRRSRSWSRTRRRSRTRGDESRGGGIGMRGGYRRRSRSISRGRKRSGSRNRRSNSRGPSRSHSPRGRRSRDNSLTRRLNYNRNSNIRRPLYTRRHWNSRSRTPSPGLSNRRKQNDSRIGSQSPNKNRKPLNPVDHKSPSPAVVRSVEVPAPPVITRYYGRNQQQSSSELSYSSGDESMSVESSNTVNNSSAMSTLQQSNKSVPDKNMRSGFGNSGGRNKVSKNHRILLLGI